MAAKLHSGGVVVGVAAVLVLWWRTAVVWGYDDRRKTSKKKGDVGERTGERKGKLELNQFFFLYPTVPGTPYTTVAGKILDKISSVQNIVRLDPPTWAARFGQG